MTQDSGLKRILILDDDADFRKLLLTFLGKLLPGVELEEYDPVARGVPAETFDWTRYDVLILDYYLCIHNVTGLDILQANRRNKFFPAAIMLTGAGNEETAVRALKAGVYDYLRKERLDKEQLRTSILDAFEKYKAESQRRSELTNQSSAFNKALFYQQLEHPDDSEHGRNRVLLLIQLDDHEVLEERLGIILRDNVVRHIAKQSYDVFLSGGCNPNVTRLSDHAVALLIDDPGSTKTLAFNIKGLCTHLKKHPYRFEDKKFRFTVSIGVVSVPREGASAETLIQRARAACDVAGAESGNSFHIVEPEAAPPQPEPVAPAVVPAAIPETGTIPETDAGEVMIPAAVETALQKPFEKPADSPSPASAKPAPIMELHPEPESGLEHEPEPKRVAAASPAVLDLAARAPEAIESRPPVVQAAPPAPQEMAASHAAPAARSPAELPAESVEAPPLSEPEPVEIPKAREDREDVPRSAGVAQAEARLTPAHALEAVETGPPAETVSTGPVLQTAPAEKPYTVLSLEPIEPRPAKAEVEDVELLNRGSVEPATAKPKIRAEDLSLEPIEPRAAKPEVDIGQVLPALIPLPERPAEPAVPAAMAGTEQTETISGIASTAATEVPAEAAIKPAQPRPTPKPRAPRGQRPAAPAVAAAKIPLSPPAAAPTAKMVQPPSAARAPATPTERPAARATATAGASAPALKPVAETAPPPPAAPAAAPKAKPASKDAVELDEPSLSDAARRIKKAFDEKRVQQIFQPIISLVNTEADSPEDIHKVYLQLIDTDGSVVDESAIYADADLPAFRKYIDRWLLRETIGRVVNSEGRSHTLVLNISEASLADPSLFNWLRKALTGLDACRPGKCIVLEVVAAEFAAEKKKAAALMNYLQGSHGFRFVLGGFKSADELKSLAGGGFHLLRMHGELFGQIRVESAEGGASALQLLKEAGSGIIVDDIKDATALTDAIAGGASYAMGVFIGDPVRRLDDTSNVESFEIA